MSDAADGAGEWQEASNSRKPFKFQRSTKSHEERTSSQNQRQQSHPASSSTANHPRQSHSTNAAASSTTLPTNSPQKYRTPSQRSSAAAGALSPSVPSSTLHSRSSSVTGTTAGSDPKKWADIESRLVALRDKQRQVSRLLSHRASHRDADDAPQQSSSNTATLRASSASQTALLTALEELKHGFVYPLQSSLIPEATFYRTLELLLELLSNEYTTLRESHAHRETSTDTNPDDAREDGSCAFGCQEVEQFKVNISVFFQLLIACLSKRQLIYSNCPSSFFQSFFPLFFQLLAPVNQTPSWVVGWMRMDALRVLAQLLQAEQKEEQERRSNEPSTASVEAKKKGTAATTSSSAVTQSMLMPYHSEIISFLLPYVDLSQLPRLLSLANTANSTSAVLDAVEAKQRLYVQLEYRRIAMQCVAHLSGRTSVSATLASSASSAATITTTHSPLPNTAYIMLFTPLLQSFEFYLKESTHSIVWISLLSSSLKTLSFMLEDVTKGVFGISTKGRAAADANVVSVLTAAQHSEILNSLVQFISDLHKCIVWGTPLVLAPDHISNSHASPPPGLASSASSSAAVPAASTAASNQPLKEALTPRSVIGPPSASPSSTSATATVGATFLSGAGSLFGSSFNILSGEHWRALQSRYALSDLTATGSADNSGSESEGRNDGGSISGWTSANESDTDVYQSRVRGNKPSRPSAVNMALEAARAGLNITSLPNSVDAAKRMAHAVASEKVRANTFGCLLNFSRVAPKFFHQYWTPFIPTDAKSAVSPRPFAGPSLLTVILFDPSTRVRLLAAQVLANVLVDSPLTRWSGAMTDTGAASGSSAATTTGAKVRKNREVKDKKKFGSAFTSLSVRFADTLRGLHIGLLESLKKEAHATVLQQVLKTISVLVVNTPYQTVYSTTGINTSSSENSSNNGLIVPIVEHLLTHMLHEASSYTTPTTAATPAAPVTASKPRAGAGRGGAGSTLSTISSTSTVLHPSHSASANSATKSDLRHAIFTCLATVFDTTSIIDEVRSFLCPPASSDSAKFYHIEVIPLFLAHARARRATDPTPDAFTLLSKLARFYPATLARYWRWNAAAGMRMNSLSALLKDCLNLSAVPATANATVAPHDVQTQLLALKILEEWNKQDSGAASSTSETGGSTAASNNNDEDDEEASGGNYEPLSNSEGFFSLEGALDMMTTQLLKVYHMHGSAVTVAAKAALTPAELHAQKQQSISSGNVRAKILACFSLLPFQQWRELSHDVRQQLIRLALDAAVDEVTAVRAASCRCLCLFALYSARAVSSTPSVVAEANVVTPQSFLLDTVQRLLTLINPEASPVIAVRLKAVWALANMADYGDKDSNNDAAQLNTKPLHELLPSQLYVQVVEAVLTSTNDNDKILSNSVRALGNLARTFPLAPLSSSSSSASSSLSEHDLSALFLRMLEVLSTRIQLSRSPKSRWNACHALGNAFHNPHLPRLFAINNSTAGSIVDRALHLLVDVVADAPSADASSTSASSAKEGAKMSNFKVRINAASALAAPPTLQHYHTSFAFILQQLLHFTQNLLADKNSSGGASGATFKDFKYLAQLKQQILTSLCVILCRYDGSQTGAASSSNNKNELFALYLAEYGALARLILGERLRWEKELRMLQRAERALLSGGASATSATSPKLVGAPSSSPLLGSSTNAATSAFSKSAVESAQALVEKAAQSVEGVLKVIEQSKPAEHTGLAQRFAAMANGELPESAMSPLSPGIPKMSL